MKIRLIQANELTELLALYAHLHRADEALPSQSEVQAVWQELLGNPRYRYYGGYLVVSHQGRPLEFRCSTPVAPSRAQEILYGASLRPYLLGELIGGALVADATVPVSAILTDHREMTALGNLRREPVFFVDETGTAAHVAAGAIGEEGAAQPSDDGVLSPLRVHVALGEPFERIRAALREAHDVAHEMPHAAADLRAA